MLNSVERCRRCDFNCELEKGAQKIVEKAIDGEIDTAAVKQATSVLSQKAGNIFHCPVSERLRVRREIAEEIGDPKLVNFTRNFTVLPKSEEVRPDSNPNRETYHQYDYARRHGLRR
jgi:hypothetical protein